MSYTITDFWKGRIGQVRQPSPVLHLYELALPDGTFARYVSFFDHKAGALPGTVDFDGRTFTTRHVERTDIQEDAQTARNQLSLTVADLDHALAYFCSQFRLEGQTLTIWITTYDAIASPSDAMVEQFQVLYPVISQDPPTVTLVVGQRNIYEEPSHKLFYDRETCHNEYHLRHVPGNWCSYPSNEFGPQTAQDYLVGALSDVQRRKFGWYTQHATRAMSFRVAENHNLLMTADETYLEWDGPARLGPNLFRPITGDFDVSTLVADLVPGRDGWVSGLLIQDEAPIVEGPEEEGYPSHPTSSWIFWGLEDDGSGGHQLLLRETTEDVSVDTRIAVSDMYLRIARVGDAWTVYSKAAEEDAWTQRDTSAVVFPTRTRVGLTIGCSSLGTTHFGAEFAYIRFAAGGLATCQFTEEDCLLHDNGIQFGGHREMPSDRMRY